MVLIARDINPIAYQILWQETLKRYEVDNKWKKIPEQFLEEKVMGSYLWRYVCKKIFYVRLKDNIYIIEGCLDEESIKTINDGRYNHVGLRCHRYNITEEKYYPCTNIFPDFLCCIDMVVTNKEETFAILLGIIADKMDYTSLRMETVCKTNLFVLTEQTGLKLLATETDNAFSQVLSKEKNLRINSICSSWPYKIVTVTDSLLLRIK